MNSLANITADYLLKTLPTDVIDILTNRLKSENDDLQKQLKSLHENTCFMGGFGLCIKCRRWSCVDSLNCECLSSIRCQNCKLCYCLECLQEISECATCGLFVCSDCRAKSKIPWFRFKDYFQEDTEICKECHERGAIEGEYIPIPGTWGKED